MKLIQGLEIYSLKTVTKNYKFIHYENDEIEIRSIHPKESIVDISVLKTILPGNLGSFIYPHDAIICYKNGSNLTKVKFQTLLKNAKNKTISNSISDLIFDVPQDKEEEEEEKNDDEDDEGEEEEDLSDGNEKSEESEEEWDEEFVEDFEIHTQPPVTD